MSTPSRYYYVDAQNQAAGPLTLDELQSLHTAGTINAATLVVPEGAQDWVAFSTLPPVAAQPAPQRATPAPVAQFQPAAQLQPVTLPQPTAQPVTAARVSSLHTTTPTDEPAWATQLLQKIDQLSFTAEKIVSALEKNLAARQPVTPIPATAALHAERLPLNPTPKFGIAQGTAVPAQGVVPAGIPSTTPRPILPRPTSASTLSPLAVPANAVRSPHPHPTHGASPTPTPPKNGREKIKHPTSKILSPIPIP
ncbi:MAG: GYF domain-containing protein [Verrucomicrobia bacterium]|nr:GYF domain-containing protein [Verrucomicrobiota bacterium]